MEQTVCLNCSTEYHGHFCPRCGQKAHTRRLTFLSLVHDIPHSVFHLDKGFVYTFLQLLRNPGRAIKGFVAGKRVSHYSPFAYLFILSAASSLVSHYKVGYFLSRKDLRLSSYSETMFPEVARFFRSYPALFFCVLIPVISLWSWMFNRKSNYNYWENLVLNTYLVAQFNLFFIIYDIYQLLIGHPEGKMTPMLTVFFTYLGFAYFSFFGGVSTLFGILSRVVLFLMIVVTVLTGLTCAGFMTRWWWW